jgi:hypothetical protein
LREEVVRELLVERQVEPDGAAAEGRRSCPCPKCDAVFTWPRGGVADA